ncbi:aspartate/glutamate racemase family protein [Phenylobacterium sp.]|uniref:aspartate/glutamate racemase family protein n=1 Tax=Phenylobacterium sp. TaxID=1871053 RepID=UPI002737928E|nr:amino acid racemase [Phenylobacterium sp.]MDP3869374.1 amino acid racemase [Phenylobacterium sp.]
MDAPLTLGILGGMGPAAAIDLMEQILRRSPRDSEQDGVRLIVDNNPRVPDRNAAILRGAPSPAPALAQMAQGLERAGADVLAMACNTAHAFQFEIERSVGIPFVSMIEETSVQAAALAEQRGRTVGLLAGDGCIAAGLYQAELGRRGLACLSPEPWAQAQFMTMLYDIKAGDQSAEMSRRMAGVAAGLEAAGADLLIAACTEVPLVLGVGMTAAPLINSTEALAAALVDYALRRRPLPPPFTSTEVGEA